MTTPLQIAFHGAAGTVTGSKHLLSVGKTKILLDAGLFQGAKKLRLMNWNNPGFDPQSVDHVLLSHTHIDHVGYLPRLVKLGLEAPVYCTPAAHDLSELMLLDSAKIQEEDARYANKKGFSKHRPALPLYTSDDVARTLELRRATRYNQWIQLEDSSEAKVRARFVQAGHLLGSSFIEIRVKRPSDEREIEIVFSGDIGRFEMPLHLDPQPMPKCDVLIVESTYGDRTHTDSSLIDQIGEPIAKALGRQGTVLIPAFAVGRSQQITHVLRRLMMARVIPEVPVHIDSPMACNATRIYSRFLDRRNIDPDVYEDGRLRLFPNNVELCKKVDDSKRLSKLNGPRIIVSSSGMMTAGRVLHHLKRLAPDPRNFLLMVGYQAYGTRGRSLIEGKKTLRIHGQEIPVRCPWLQVHGLSGHADSDELLQWVEAAGGSPKVAFLVHGEPKASEALGARIRSRFGSRTIAPRIGDRHDLDVELDRA